MICIFLILSVAICISDVFGDQLGDKMYELISIALMHGVQVFQLEQSKHSTLFPLSNLLKRRVWKFSCHHANHT